MARKTKYDLERQVARLQAELDAARVKITTLTAVPGEFQHHRQPGTFVGRPMPRDWETRKWITDGAHNLVCDGCEHGYEGNEGVEWTELFVPYADDVLPPGVDGVIVRYSLDHESGTIISGVWPAVRIN